LFDGPFVFRLAAAEIPAQLFVALPLAALLGLAAGVGNALLRCGGGSGRAFLLVLAGGFLIGLPVEGGPDLLLGLLVGLARVVLAGGVLLRSGRALPRGLPLLGLLPVPLRQGFRLRQGFGGQVGLLFGGRFLPAPVGAGEGCAAAGGWVLDHGEVTVCITA